LPKRIEVQALFLLAVEEIAKCRTEIETRYLEDQTKEKVNGQIARLKPD
jgi:hypothetical protein